MTIQHLDSPDNRIHTNINKEMKPFKFEPNAMTFIDANKSRNIKIHL